MDLIIEYLIHYNNTEPKEIPFPGRTDEDFLKGILNDECTQTYHTNTNQSLEGLINLINAANYMQSKKGRG